MRGREKTQGSMLALIDPNARVPKDHPIRAIKELADQALRQMSRRFDAIYGETGRPSIPPETLLKATILMALYTVRSERQFCEQLDYNILFRWFLDMDLVSPSFDHSVFSKNRLRLIEADVAKEFFVRIVDAAQAANLISHDHFSVDGSLIEAWASLKSFRAKDQPKPPKDPEDPGNPTVDFHGEKRSNATHESTTDPEAKLMRKSNGTTARLSFGVHAVTENRNGLLVNLCVEQAVGTTERQAAIAMLTEMRPPRRSTIAGDKGFDTRDFVRGCREQGFVPHVAAKNEHSAIDSRTTRHSGYTISQRFRKRIEEVFGWAKTIGGLRRTRYKGRARTEFYAVMVGATYNLLRIARLMPIAA
jgi:transposase